MFIGHKREDGAIQTLEEHLNGVAGLAAKYAGAFGGERHAHRAGLLHDVGKCSPAGQVRMRDPEHTKKVDHATAGAKIAFDGFAQYGRDIPAAFAIAGHHGGMPDIGVVGDADGSGTLFGRIQKKLDGQLDYSAWKSIVDCDPQPCYPAWLDLRDAWSVQFYTRMLFSCLVDADYIDTEAFMQNGAVDRGGYDALEILLERLDAHIAPRLASAANPMNRKRNEILEQCIAGADGQRGMYTLTVPTGGGKTVSSLAYALHHAVKHGMKRIIYVIPYTSIIEQNAAVFADILGARNVLEHHSNIGQDDDAESSGRQWSATENWDSPVVVTTAVQFFESLYASKPSQCRKLHNIADSVIIFDEAQMLPLSYLRPCVAGMAELVKHYGVTAVLCTATQPALEPLIHEFAPGMQIREICPNADDMQDFFRRVSFAWEKEFSDEQIAQALLERRQALCIVNTRRRAANIYDLLQEEGCYHLSTLMTPEDRKAILSEVRKRLKNGEVCRVVSTSLIEAGVDVDFPEVWREEAGLDSILQAAGRCNREGKRGAEESAMHIFRAEGKPLRTIEQNIAAMNNAVRQHAQPDTSAAIQAYFAFLYKLRSSALDIKDILSLVRRFAFRSASESFRLIESDTITVYIPTDHNADLIAQLRYGQVSRSLLRRLGQAGVNIYRQHFEALRQAGKIEECGGFFILADAAAYDPKRGLTLDADAGAAIWI